MADTYRTGYVPNNALPPFFQDLRIICSASEEMKEHRAKFHTQSMPQSIQCQVTSVSTPKLYMNRRIKHIYQSNDFKEIKRLEKQTRADLQSVYDKIEKDGAGAWTKVEKGGKEFYICCSNSGCIWSCVQNTTGGGNDTKFKAVVQVGTYSQSSCILGVHDYNLSLTGEIVKTALSLIIAIALSGIVAKGLAFLVSEFAVLACQAAASLGLEAFSCTIAASAVANVAIALVAVIAFIGLSYLWEWLNRRYTICLRIYNWDTAHDWNTTACHLDNAKIAGTEQKSELFSIPRMTDPGSLVYPPGFKPVEALNAVCSYGIIIWENQKTFLQGCAMAMCMQSSGGEGFTWGFDCPRMSKNKHKADSLIHNPQKFLDKYPWNPSPLRFEITCANQIPVSFGLNALSGADDNLYDVNIHINHKQD